MDSVLSSMLLIHPIVRGLNIMLCALVSFATEVGTGTEVPEGRETHLCPSDRFGSSQTQSPHWFSPPHTPVLLSN